MLYRDLIPSRLGGRYIASHITIAEGGPVADWVHFHRVAFQLICVRRAGCGSSTRTRASRSSCRPATWSCSRPNPPSRARKLARAGSDRDRLPGAARDLRRPRDGVAERRHRRPTATSRASASCIMSPPTRRGRRGTAPKRRRRRCARRPAGSPKRARSGPAPGPPSPFPPHDGELVFGFVLEGSAGSIAASSTRARPGRRLRHPAGRGLGLGELSRRLSAAPCDDRRGKIA